MLDGLTDRVVAQHAVSPLVDVLGVGITRRAIPVPKNREIGLGIFESIQVVSQGGEPLQLVFMLVAADFFAVGDVSAGDPDAPGHSENKPCLRVFKVVESFRDHFDWGLADQGHAVVRLLTNCGQMPAR